MITISDLPNVKLNRNGSPRQTQPFTLPNLCKVMAHMKVAVRFNVMLAEPAFYVDGKEVPHAEIGLVLEHLLDMLTCLDINAAGRLDTALLAMARLDPFHPMEDWLKGLSWDGVSRLDDLIASVVTDNPLWPTYLENWMVQVVAGVCGWHDNQKASLPHALVLVGGQGVGKTHWLRRLGAGWMKTEAELHLASVSGKDHQLEVLRWPMAELAELDGIFRKSDVSHLKAFMSREEDALRAPYARRAVVRPRMTTFCGSVNDAEFLTDTTGSRRFWPVQVESISWTFDMDWGQLWAEAYAMWQDNPDFSLTAAENAQRDELALSLHTLASPEQETIEEYLRLHEGRPAQFPLVAMNRTEVMNMLFGGYQHWNRVISLAGRVLSDKLGPHRNIGGKQRCWMVPFNEYAKDRSTWPKSYQIKSVS